jgi:hypothetical protein
MAGEAADGERPAEHPASGQPGPVPPQERPTAGDPRVDAALARLDELPGIPVTEHPQVFDDVHRRLADVLDELDADRPGSAGQEGAGQEGAGQEGAGQGRDAVPGPGR